MNRRIYLNDKYLEFTGAQTQSAQDQSFKSYTSSEREKKLREILKDFVDESQKECIRISHLDADEAIRIMKKEFYYIEAAGGFIQKDDTFLYIRRHDRWDLPKGKLEKGEGIKHAAIRECEEECAVKNLEILRPLSSTFHMYQYKDGYALKQSYWFHMRTDYSEKLIPQIEESITEVKWFTKKEIEDIILQDTYYTISDVTRDALESL